MTTLTWLHLSDLHAHPAATGWDAARVEASLLRDLEHLKTSAGLVPDLILFTGDAAFGEVGTEPPETVRGQLAVSGELLDRVRRAVDPDLPWENVFLVPGNHDVNRSRIDPAHTLFLDQRESLEEIEELIRQGRGSVTWRGIMGRLADYRRFLEHHGNLDHLLADPERLIYGARRRIAGVTVGLAGFNSAWSCGREKERGRLWMAGRFQQETLRRELEGADVKLALMHHPPAWLVTQESPKLGQRLRQDFHFLLHGHDHQEWVEEQKNAATVLAAGACYEGSERDNGYNLVRLDLEEGKGEVWLRRFDPAGGGWVPRIVYGKTDERGVWLLELPWARGLAGGGSGPPRPEASAPAVPPPPELSPELTRYLWRLRAAHRDLPVVGFETRVRIPIRLDKVYVPLRARIVRRALESEWPEVGAGRHLEAETDDREIRLEEALTLARKHDLPGLAVLGDPGSGKTTLLKHLVRAATDPAAGAETLGLPADTVPVFIPLRRLGRPTEGLEAAVAEAVAEVDPTLDAPVFARRLLARDRLLVLLDGLDELADETTRAAVSRWIEEAVPRLPGSHLVVTSRYAGYKRNARLDGRFLELHVRDLGEPEARRFVTAWYDAVESQVDLGRDPEAAAALARTGASGLTERLFDAEEPRTRGLRRLAANPLMLQILCLVYRDRQSLPELRVELYRECLTVLLESWRRAKKLPLEVTSREAVKLLQPLAWALQAEGRQEAPLEEIVPYLEAPLRELGADPGAARSLLEAIRDQSGALVSLGEEDYGFLHLSLQEYLAARHVQDRILAAPELLGELAGRFGEPSWREVILLAVGLDNPSLFEPLMRELLNQGRLHRDAALAGDLLRDALTTTPAPVVEALAAGLEPWEERYAALQLLKRPELAGWPDVATAEGTPGREVVAALARPEERESVRGLARELVGGEAVEVPGPVTRARDASAEPRPGVERIHEADGSVLVYVPGGEYPLGAEDLEELGFGQAFADRARPEHRVVLSAFWIGKYPVTNEQYARFLEAHPDREPPRFWEDRQHNQPAQPVVGVSWHDARAYCRWAGLALPTEAQWEAAARGGDRRRYPWGSEPPGAEHANFDGREGKPTPVGAYPAGAGPFGTLDQAGNVWEWCADRFDAAAYRDRDGVRDPSIPPQGDDAPVALRGGSWIYPARYLAAAVRYRYLPTVRLPYIGFRVVLSSVSEHA